ncbi:hypothetical protein EXIGLDRAFT_694092, partial [Exidia glandulosa HHB12029]
MDAVHDVATLEILLGQFESYKSVPQLATIIPNLIKQPLALEVVLADAPLLPSLVAAFDRENNLDLGRRRRKVHSALECLHILEEAAFPAARNGTLNEDPDADDEDEDTAPFIRQKRGKKKRAQRAAAAASNVAPALNADPFRKLTIAVPTSQSGAEQAIRVILGILGDELKRLIQDSQYLLTALRSPSCVNALKDALITSIKPPVKEQGEQ